MQALFTYQHLIDSQEDRPFIFFFGTGILLQSQILICETEDSITLASPAVILARGQSNAAVIRK